MIRHELAETLLSLISGVETASEAGMDITEVLVEMPLEIYSSVRKSKLVFYGTPPHTRWKSGILPEVHQSRLRLVALPQGDTEHV